MKEKTMKAQLDRRKFMSALAAIGVVGRFAGIIALSPVAFMMTACSFSVSGVLNVIIGAVQGILTIAGDAPWATELSAALATLQQQIAAWKTGSPAAIVIDALNTIEAIAAVIPFTAVFSPLIDLLVSAIESVIDYFTSQPANAIAAIRFTHARSTRQTNAHIGRVACAVPDKTHPTYEGALKAQWNALASSLQLPKAAIK
jgi:hypothetical protein